MRLSRPFALLAFPLSLAAQSTNWRAAGGEQGFSHHSPLKQIHRSNVHKLQQAWTYDTGDVFEGSEIQCNPIVLDGVLYATSPKNRVFALNAATGKLKWSFDPFQGNPPKTKFRSRGLMFYQDPATKARRILAPVRYHVYALDAETGHPIPSFGNDGRIDLRENLGRPAENLTLSVTSPGVIYKDLYITGFLTSEGLPSAPGDIRGYDVHTGALRWSFHTIPHPGEFGYETWPADGWKYLGGANSWPGLTLDEKRGIVFVPTGSAAFDFYGANRHGDNLFANSLIALDAGTGKRKWHFQFVKHDVWDRDLPSAPVLVQARREGKLIDAVAQTTKSGHLWVFNRETGESLFPWKEIEVPPSPVDGERLARTQPLPLKPEPFSRQHLTEDVLTKRTPAAHQLALERLRSVRSSSQFEPPSFEGSIVFPGFDGGAEWGGPAYDPETRNIYINANEMAWILRIVPKPPAGGAQSGKTLYNRHCAACHREDLGGSPPEFPSLRGIAGRRTVQQVDEIIVKGAGRMPGFNHLRNEPIAAITRYLITGKDTEAVSAATTSSPIDLKYTTDGYNKFLDPDGYPAIAPPWGTLNAINLDTGEYAWKIPFGEFPKLAAQGLRNTGTENYGGGVVTAGGLLFIGATNHDNKFRAFDKLTGKLLWETTLPAAGNATPAVYQANGRQFVVIAAGGGKSGAPSGGSYVAFALPQ
ncbi:MAG: PQQ-binding-like beta-propeller repeat protein [Bryobacterales bacterium]|nr:PQQ-binding-like beta-propeller repeat protein [Bryobacterales bacterium]